MPLAALVQGAFDTLGNFMSMEEAARNRRFQAEQSQLNRDWQSSENQASRDWQERMWNAQNVYNSPSAMMSRYREAGLNPFLLGGNAPVVGKSESAPQASSVGGFTPAPSGSQAHVGFSNLGQLLMQSRQISANVANQKAEALSKLVDSATKAYQVGGLRAYKSVVHTFAPFMIDSDPNNSPYERLLTSQVRENVSSAILQENQGALVHAYGEKQALQGLEESNYRISEIVARLNTMRITNDIAIKKLANDTIVAAAEAFNLQKQGDYYYANARQINALRKYVVEQAKAAAELAGNEVQISREETPLIIKGLESGYTRQRNENEFRGSKFVIYTDFITDQFGKIVHIGLGKNSSKVSVDSPENVPYNSKTATWQTRDQGHDVIWKETRYSK